MPSKQEVDVQLQREIRNLESRKSGLNELSSELDESFIATDDPGLDNKPINKHKVHSAKDLAQEAIIDELISTVPTGQGYYLKLYKESGSDRWEFKIRIDSFEHWSDLELEIVNLVRSYTIKNPQRWGSALYKIVIWRDAGLREKYRPIFFTVDAMEPPVTQSGNPVQQNNSLEEVASVMKTIQDIVPQQDPAQNLNQMAGAFQKGIEISGGNKQDNSMQMMIPIITGMFSSMSDLYKNNNGNDNNKMESIQSQFNQTMSLLLQNMNKPVSNPVETYNKGFTQALAIFQQMKPKETSLSETLKELSALGLIGNNGNNNNSKSPIDQLSDLGKMVEVVKSIFPTSTPPQLTITEKIIEKLLPMVPDVLERVTGTVNKVMEMKKSQAEAVSQVAESKRILKANRINENHQQELNFGTPTTYQRQSGDSVPSQSWPEPSINPYEDEEVNDILQPPPQNYHSPPLDYGSTIHSVDRNQASDEEKKQLEALNMARDMVNAVYKLITEYQSSELPTTTNNRCQELLNAIESLVGSEYNLIDNISSGTWSQNTIILFLKNTGDSRYKTPQFEMAFNTLFPKFKTYIDNLKNLVTVNAKCNKCGAEYDIPIDELTQNPYCDTVNKGIECDGILIRQGLEAANV